MTVNDSNLITILIKKEIQFHVIEKRKMIPFVRIKISKNICEFFAQKMGWLLQHFMDYVKLNLDWVVC